jgi:hypothetical protein
MVHTVRGIDGAPGRIPPKERPRRGVEGVELGVGGSTYTTPFATAGEEKTGPPVA